MLDTARFILSKSKALEKYGFVKELCDEVSYSLKTNYEVGKVLQDNTDSSFSVHSVNEIRRVDYPERVWYFSQAWDEPEMDLLFDGGVRRFVVDNISDLRVLLKFLEQRDDKIDLLLRMRLKENTVHTGKHYVYGMYSKQVNELIPKLRSNDKIRKLGVHFHRKSQNVSEWSLKYELEQCLSEVTLKKIDIVNIGGGIPGQYKNFRQAVLDSIITRIKEFREWLQGFGIKMIIEPGRFISAYCVELETTIKNIYDNNIIVNCSVYNGAMDTFVAHFRLLVKGELKQGEGQAYAIKGNTPCSMDLFRYRVYLDNPKVGDKIIFENAGAYNFSTDFCSLEKLETVVVN